MHPCPHHLEHHLFRIDGSYGPQVASRISSVDAIDRLRAMFLPVGIEVVHEGSSQAITRVQRAPAARIAVGEQCHVSIPN